MDTQDIRGGNIAKIKEHSGYMEVTEKVALFNFPAIDKEKIWVKNQSAKKSDFKISLYDLKSDFFSFRWV